MPFLFGLDKTETRMWHLVSGMVCYTWLVVGVFGWKLGLVLMVCVVAFPMIPGMNTGATIVVNGLTRPYLRPVYDSAFRFLFGLCTSAFSFVRELVLTVTCW